MIVANDSSPASARELMEAIQRELGDSLHSLWWNGNPERTNVILGPHWEHQVGPATLCEQIGGVRVHYPPGAFGQSHLGLADRLAARVAAWIPESARVCEFHAGCGALSLGWLGRIGHLDANELAPAGLAGLHVGLAERPAPERNRVQIVPGRAAHHTELVDGADVVVVDPPRSGLEPELLARLTDDPPRRLITVACGLDAFERETQALLAARRLELAELRVFDLFPYTEHVETLARFERRSS